MSTINFKKMKTSQEQLVARYRKFVTLASLFSIAGGASIYNISHDLLLSLGFGAYMVLCAVMDYVLMRKTQDIDVSDMTVKEVSARALSCRRLHHTFQLILIPILVVLLIYLFSGFSDNEYAVWGMCLGAAIGLAIGLREYFYFMDDYRSLIKG